MPSRIDDQQISFLSAFVSRRLGLHFPQKRWPDLRRLITHAAPDLGFTDVAACIRWILSAHLGKEQLEVLASHLTIGETYFFREQASFEMLESRILPDLISSRRGKEQRLRIWSAGCSTGEEPYSIAILLGRLMPDLKEWNITILATDINGRAISKAKQGIYGEWSFRGVPEDSKRRFFASSNDGRYEVPYATREMVSFSRINLVEDPYPSPANNTSAMDIIFCRNVLMYFGARQQQQVIRKFRQTLQDGGWLVVSPCETSPMLSACFETVSLPGAIFYRKTDRAPDRIAPSPGSDVTAHAARHLPQEPPGQPQPLPEPPLPAMEVAEAEVRQDEASAPGAPQYDEALALFRQGLYNDAEDKIAALFDNCSATGDMQVLGEAAALMTQMLANRGDLVRALEWSEKAILADKLNAGLYCLHANILQEQGEAAQAITTLKKAIYLDPHYVMAHFALGMLTLRCGQAKEAGRHFNNALSLLGACQPSDSVPGSEGLTAGRLSEIIASTLAGPGR